jgi:uncharacterized membrane protein YgdD (TMEM256/DUF423 family)
MDKRMILIVGGLFMALAVVLGAFGAHALKESLSPEMMRIYNTGVDYQFYNALGLMLIGLTGFQIESKYIKWSGLLTTIGIIIFSGSLYVLALSGIKWIGAITPIGGLSFVAGWITFVLAIRDR